MEKVLETWLFALCRMLSEATHAVLLTGPPDEGPFDRILFWPDQKGDHAVLAEVAQAALNSKQAVVKNGGDAVENSGGPPDVLACPLFLKGSLFGAVAIEMTHRPPPLQKLTASQVQAGAKWLETLMSVNGPATRPQLVNLVELVAAGLEHEQFRVAATEVAGEFSERFSCRRASIGFVCFNRVRVAATSHGSRIDPNSNLVCAIGDAMGEAVDQAETVVYPAESEETLLVTRFHGLLAKAQQGAAICTVPLVKNGKAVGALLLERGADNPFTAETVAQCEQIGLLLGPVLETRRKEERPLAAKIFESWQEGCARLFGRRHLSLKLSVSLTAALLVWLCSASAMFRIPCDFVLEAAISQVVVAPQQGYIAAAHVRAGDLVREGDLLASLDDRELKLEQRKWQGQRGQLLKEYRKALAGADRAEVAILKARRGQAEAQLRLVEQQLVRAKLVAPFSGLVVKGDLSQALGSPVTRGEVLYEVAPMGEYRGVLKVDDRDIGLVAVGQRGQLKLSGVPDRTIAITIDRLTPVSTAGEGRNYFRVEAVMDSHSDLMRPGMEGVAKITIGEEKLIWIVTRRWVDWLRLFVWGRLP